MRKSSKLGEHRNEGILREDRLAQGHYNRRKAQRFKCKGNMGGEKLRGNIVLIAERKGKIPQKNRATWSWGVVRCQMSILMKDRG